MKLLGVCSIAVLFAGVGCTSAAPVHHAPVITGASTCRPIGAPKTLARGLTRPIRIEATGDEHQIGLGFYQVPFRATAVAVDPWELTISDTTHVDMDVNRPAPRVVPHFENSNLSVESAPREDIVKAVGPRGTLLVRLTEDRRRIEWLVERDAAVPTLSLSAPDATVSYRTPSAIALPDGRFAIAFSHVCPFEEAAMVLTLDDKGSPLGEPTQVSVEEDAFRPRLSMARDGRALLAYSSADGLLRGVPIGCGVDVEQMNPIAADQKGTPQ